MKYSGFFRRHNFLLNISIIILFALFSLTIINYYEFGDRFVYRESYDIIAENTLLDGIKLYFLYFSSPDFIWFLFAYLSSFFFLSFNSFTFFLSLAIFIAFFGVAKFYITNRRLYCLFIINLFINIQFLTIFFSSERLGFAFLFFCFSLISSGGFKKSILVALSIFSHFTITVLYMIAIAMRSASDNYSKNKKKFLLLIVSILCLVFYMFGDLITTKAVHYFSNTTGVSKNFLKFLPVPFLVYFASKNSLHLFINIIFCVVLTIFDEERFFQLGYMFSCWAIYTLNSFRALVVGVLFSIIPSIRGIEFIIGVFTRGNGLDPVNFGGGSL